MSDQTTKRAWEAFIYGLPVEAIPAKIKPANFKAVALCLGYHSDWNTLQNMSASMVTIARETTLHRNTVDKVVSAMVEMGLAVQREDKRSWGSKTGKWTYVYDLYVPVSHMNVNRVAFEDVTDVTDSVTVEAQGSHLDVPVSHLRVPDSHLEVPVSHLSVNNHTYNHTYNHTFKEDESVSVLAGSDLTLTHVFEDSQASENRQLLSGPSNDEESLEVDMNSVGLMKTDAAAGCETVRTVFDHCIDCGERLKGSFNETTKRCLKCHMEYTDKRDMDSWEASKAEHARKLAAVQQERMFK